MFTGIVEGMGTVLWLRRTQNGTTQLKLKTPPQIDDLKIGDSLAINGCCLTLTERKKDILAFDLLQETLDKTNLKNLRADSMANLERPLKADMRLGGHFVSGHVDNTAEVISMVRHGGDYRLEITLPPAQAHYVAYKGSITINGVSLTIAEVLETSFAIWLIPHTLKVTNLGILTTGDEVNLEFDILAKYLERMVQQTGLHLPDKA